MPEDRLHVTLAFLGSRTEAEAARAAEVLAHEAGALAARDPGILRVARGLTLPPRRPRVAAAGLAGADDALVALQTHLAAALVAAGIHEPEDRPFLPHVTVARARRGARPPAALPAAPELGFRPDAVTLFESSSGRGGPRYEALASVALTGG